MRTLYNGSECYKMTRWDRTKDQMIRRLNMHQCIRTSSARPNMRIILRMLVRPKGGYIYRLFRRILVDLIEWKRRYYPRRWQKWQPNIKVDCGLKQIWLFSLYCISKLLAPVLFLLSSLFLSVSRLIHGQSQFLSLSLFYQNIAGRKWPCILYILSAKHGN